MTERITDPAICGVFLCKKRGHPLRMASSLYKSVLFAFLLLHQIGNRQHKPAENQHKESRPKINVDIQ
jgi:hypothetical protein